LSTVSQLKRFSKEKEKKKKARNSVSVKDQEKVKRSAWTGGKELHTHLLRTQPEKKKIGLQIKDPEERATETPAYIHLSKGEPGHEVRAQIKVHKNGNGGVQADHSQR